MPNPYVLTQLEGLLDSLRATHATTQRSSSASKGAGRADFVHRFLQEVLPPAYRIKTSAEVTDIRGQKSGELDIVLENGFFPSLPLMGSERSRLHFAEGVGAVIEVKSNLPDQWQHALETGKKLKSLDRKFAGGQFGGARTPQVSIVPSMVVAPQNSLGKLPPSPQDSIREKIPFFVVGYEGWATRESLTEKIRTNPDIIDGILQISPGYFIAGPAFSGVQGTNACALLAFINSIHEAFSYVQNAIGNILDYGR